MSQRIDPADELFCGGCGHRGFDDEPICFGCDKPFVAIKIKSVTDVERMGAVITAVEDGDAGDYGRTRVYAEEGLTKMVLRAIENRVADASEMAAAMLKILDEKAERLYG